MDDNTLAALLYEGLRRRTMYCRDVATPSDDVSDIRHYVTLLKNELSHSMPAITFVSGFWKNVMDLVDSQQMASVFDVIAIENNCLVDHVAAAFFREVIFTCRNIQATTVPRPIYHMFGQQRVNNIDVRIFNRRVATISYTSVGQLKVHAIAYNM